MPSVLAISQIPISAQYGMQPITNNMPMSELIPHGTANGTQRLLAHTLPQSSDAMTQAHCHNSDPCSCSQYKLSSGSSQKHQSAGSWCLQLRCVAGCILWMTGLLHPMALPPTKLLLRVLTPQSKTSRVCWGHTQLSHSWRWCTDSQVSSTTVSVRQRACTQESWYSMWTGQRVLLTLSCPIRFWA